MAQVVPTPAPERAGFLSGAGVEIAGTDLHRRLYRDWVTLLVVIEAPADDPRVAVTTDRAGMGLARGDSLEFLEIVGNVKPCEGIVALAVAVVAKAEPAAPRLGDEAGVHRPSTDPSYLVNLMEEVPNLHMVGVVGVVGVGVGP